MFILSVSGCQNSFSETKANKIQDETEEVTIDTTKTSLVETVENSESEERIGASEQIELIANNRSLWQYSPSDSMGIDSYAITNFDCDEYIEILSTSHGRYSYASTYRLYEVNDDNTGLNLIFDSNIDSLPRIDFFPNHF